MSKEKQDWPCEKQLSVLVELNELFAQNEVHAEFIYYIRYKHYLFEAYHVVTLYAAKYTVILHNCYVRFKDCFSHSLWEKMWAFTCDSIEPTYQDVLGPTVPIIHLVKTGTWR